MAAHPVDIDTILNAQMINDPLTKYMFCSPAEGRSRWCWRAEEARELGRTQVRLKAADAHASAGLVRVFAPYLDLERGHSATVIASRAAVRWPASARGHRRRAAADTSPERRSCTWPRTVSARMASERGSPRSHAHRWPAADQHGWQLSRAVSRSVLRSTAGLRECRAVARPGWRATGARQAADGVQPCLRCAGRVGRRDPRALSPPWTWNSPPASRHSARRSARS